MRNLRSIGLAVALAAVASAASAGVRVSAHLKPGGFIINTPAAAFLPLNGAGATSLSFKLPSAGKKVLTYSALCAVKASEGDNDQWYHLDIYVNGKVVPATVDANGLLCGSNETAAFDGWVRASITVQVDGKKGDNTVRIEARPSGYAQGLYILESQLVVHD